MGTTMPESTIPVYKWGNDLSGHLLRVALHTRVCARGQRCLVLRPPPQSLPTEGDVWESFLYRGAQPCPVALQSGRELSEDEFEFLHVGAVLYKLSCDLGSPRETGWPIVYCHHKIPTMGTL